MSTITGQFDLHTRLFNNVVAGIADDLAGKVQGPDSNHVQFLAGHLVFTRLMMKDFAGLAGDERFAAFEKNMDPNASYLPMSDIIAKWNEIAGPIGAALKHVPAEAWAGAGPFPSPMGASLEDCIGFLMHHEAYHLGQMAILRKMSGLEAMSYK